MIYYGWFTIPDCKHLGSTVADGLPQLCFPVIFNATSFTEAMGHMAELAVAVRPKLDEWFGSGRADELGVHVRLLHEVISECTGREYKLWAEAHQDKPLGNNLELNTAAMA
jgi:hypothetical protein